MDNPNNNSTPRNLPKAILYNLKEGYNGLTDALWIPWVFQVILKSPEAQFTLGHVVMFNGIICLGSFLLFQTYVQPFIHHLFSTNISPDSILSPVGYIIESFLVGTYYLLWMVPLFLLSFVINPPWLNEVSTKSFVVLTGKPPEAASVNPWRLPKQLAVELYTTTFYTMFVLQAFLCYLVPFFGGILNIIFLCWLYSLYCFEYKWTNWNISRRLRYIENHWSYFVGFGLVVGIPFTLTSYIFGFWVSYAVWWLLFPFFIITAIGTKNPQQNPTDEQVRASFALFRLAKYLNTVLLTRLAQLYSQISKGTRHL